jgi:DNA-directed RNA polymerase specialized sigma24 family protein
MHRAQRFEREALEELFDRNVGRVYSLCFALSDGIEDAEVLAGQTFRQALDRLTSFQGDARAFDGWVLRQAAMAAGRHGRPDDVLLTRFRRLSGNDQATVALRLLAGMDSDRVAQAMRRPAGDVRGTLVAGLRRLSGHSLGWTSGSGSLVAFDAALERVLTGADPEQEGARLRVPQDATVLLQVARTVANRPREPLGPHAAARLRTMFLADAAERRTVWVQRHRSVPLVPGIELRRGPGRVSTSATLLLAGLLAVAVGATIAIFVMFAGPDSPTYPLKGFAESSLLMLNRDPTSRADFELKLASTRSREAEDMAVAGKGDLAVSTTREQFNLLRGAGYDLARAGRRDSRWLNERNQFSAQASQSTQEIQNDLKATHQRSSADQIKALTDQFQRDRKYIDSQVGAAQPGPQPSPSPST